MTNADIQNRKRRKIVISGYYGFDNLGDEAILERVTTELSSIANPEDIVVLSANPESTKKVFGVSAVKRTDLQSILSQLRQARLFISGGGGLFQNTRSLGSILFYGFQIAKARALGTPVMIYAQGIGPLHGSAARALCKQFFAMAQGITLRDIDSFNLARSWGLPAHKTADPVWLLEPGQLPADVQELFDRENLNVALSLRSYPSFTDRRMEDLAETLCRRLPAGSRIILAPLQPEVDRPVLARFGDLMKERGRDAVMLDPESMRKPSNWMAFFGKCDMTIAMRLHAVVMALSQGKPVAGIAYDPKVAAVCAEFEQPILNLTKDTTAADWDQSLKTLVGSREKLSALAGKHGLDAKKLACQNFEVIAKILDKR